jgi:hypothetical protein
MKSLEVIATVNAETAETASFDKYSLSETLILRQAQDERRVEGLRMSAHGEPVEPCELCVQTSDCFTDAEAGRRSPQKKTAAARSFEPTYGL